MSAPRTIWGAPKPVTVRAGEMPPFEIHAMEGFPYSHWITVYRLHRHYATGELYYRRVAPEALAGRTSGTESDNDVSQWVCDKCGTRGFALGAAPKCPHCGAPEMQRSGTESTP